MATNVVIQGVLSYPHIFAPRAYQAGDDPKYSASIIITDPNFDWTAVQAANAEALASAFPAGAPAGVKTPFSQVKDGPYVGLWQVTATAKQDRPPELVDQRVQPIMDQSHMYAGCIVNAAINAFGYAGGSSFGLNKLQLVSNDASLPRLDGGKSAAETFEVVPGGPVATAQQPGAPVAQPMAQPVAQPMAQPAMAQPQMAPPMAQPGQPAMAPAPAPVGMPAPVMGQPAVVAAPPMGQPAPGVVTPQQPMAGQPQQPVMGQPVAQPMAQPGQPAVQVGAPGQPMPWNQ